MTKSLAAQASHDGQPATEDEVQLQTEYGLVVARVRTNQELARTLYDIDGPRMRGSLTVYPQMTQGEHELLPGLIEVAFGDLLSGATASRWGSYRYMPQATQVNGIAVLGYKTTTAAAVLNDSLYTWARRLLNDVSSARLPDASQDRLTGLTKAVLRHWLGRADLHQLRLTVARLELPARMKVERQKVERTQAEIDKLKSTRDQHLAQAEECRRFLADNQPKESA